MLHCLSLSNALSKTLRDGRLVRGRGCQLCLGCEMTCPEDAITSPVSLPIFRPFILYNVRHGARDPMGLTLPE